ncbi:MAG: substrate-binding domain-containing protein [Bacillota bacterium]
MEYLLKPGLDAKKKYRIGFLDDNVDNDFHNQLLAGIAEAAEELDVEIIRFSCYYSELAGKFPNQANMTLDYIRQFDLDGLMFLGWSYAGAMYNRDEFMRRFESVPILSIGTVYEDIPNVSFVGDEFIGKIVFHLVEKHHLKRIAFIDHFRTDGRKGAYINAMKEHGLYDPLLIVSDADLAGTDQKARGRRAVEILLDERKVDVEAIISLYINETEFVIKELKKRGIEIPGGIAVTSYEDGYLGQYSSPGYTTVYYPWKELGHTGLMVMSRLLDGERVPMETSLKSMGHIIYRESCGCLPHYIKAAPDPGVAPAPHNPARMTEDEAGEVAEALKRRYGKTGLNYKALVKSFAKACEKKDERLFLSELDRQLQKLRGGQDIEGLIADARELLYPYLVADTGTLLWAGDLFLQSQVLVNEKLACLRGNEIVEDRMIDQNLQFISHALLADFSLQELTDTLEKGMESLKIRSCHIFAAGPMISDSNDPKESVFDKCLPVFRYRDGRRESIPETETAASLRQQLSRLFAENNERVLLAYLLHVTDEILGFALFDYGAQDTSVYQALSIHISAAFSRIILLKRLDETYGKLVEHARKEGMADIAADILHNIGNTLNSVNVSVHLMDECSKSALTDDIIMAGGLIRENMHRIDRFISEDGRGKKLLRFYLKLGRAAEKMQDQLQLCLDRLRAKINEINGTIAAQQNYAVTDAKPEEMPIEPMLEDVLMLNQDTFYKLGITVEKNYIPGFKSCVHRAKLFFVLFNMIVNAVDSMANVPETNRKLTVSMHEDNTGKYLRISDTGSGIPENILNRIFEDDFTTKYGRYGYGLYNCAGYMSDMGGSIRAESPGEGKGASFILKFC